MTLKLGSGLLWFLCSALLLLNEIYTPLKFHVQICNSLWDIVPTSLWQTDTKFKYEQYQRAITLKLGSGGLWVLFSALLLNEIYTPLKFHVQFCNSLWDIAPTSLLQTDGRTAGRTTPNLYIPPPSPGDNYNSSLRLKNF